MAEGLHHAEVGAALNEIRGLLAAQSDQIRERTAGVVSASEVEAKLEAMQADMFARIDKVNDSLEAIRKDAASAALAGHSADFEITDEDRRYMRAAHGQPVDDETIKLAKQAWDHCAKGAADPAALAPKMRAALQIGSGPQGGFLVFPELDRQLRRRVFDVSPVRQYATVRRITGDSLVINGTSSKSSVTWHGEGSAIAEGTNPVIERLEIPVRAFHDEQHATLEMWRDPTFDLGSFILDEASDSLAIAEGDAFWTGNGATRPKGIDTYTRVLSASFDKNATWNKIEKVKTGANGSFAGTDPADVLLDLITKIKRKYRATSKFFGRRAALAALLKLKASTSGDYTMIPRFDQASGLNLQIMGYQFVEDESVPDHTGTGNAGIWFGDMSGYIIVDKLSTYTLVDPYSSHQYVKVLVFRQVGGAMRDFDSMKALTFEA